MTKKIKDEEYLYLINHIMENSEFQKMNNIKHHNTTRMDHSLKVSYYSYKIAKSLRLDYEDVARGGLLHDFYTEQISECSKIRDKIKQKKGYYSSPSNLISLDLINLINSFRILFTSIFKEENLTSSFISGSFSISSSDFLS